MQHSNAIFKQVLLALSSVFCLMLASGCSQNAMTTEGSTGGSGTDSKEKTDGARTGTITEGGTPGTRDMGGSDGRSRFDYVPGGSSYAGTNRGDNDITPAGLNNPDNLLSQRIIYFDYNQSSIRPEYMVLLNTHAQLLAKYPNLKVRLEGHADERGSREYNIALSEDRAMAVKRLMGTQGARGYQMSTIGFGEEMPVVSGHTQDSWQKNRRVEIKYKNY